MILCFNLMFLQTKLVFELLLLCILLQLLSLNLCPSRYICPTGSVLKVQFLCFGITSRHTTQAITS